MSTEQAKSGVGAAPAQRIERVVQPNPELAELIFQKHTEIFDAVRDEHPLYQGLYRKDYDPLAASPDTTFYLAWNNDKLVGHLIASNNIADVRWLSDAYFEKHYPNKLAAKKLHFVASLGVDNGCSPKLVTGLIDALVVAIAREGGVAIAEFRMTKHNARLPVLIAGRSTSLAEATVRRLPSEQFFAFEVANLRDDPLNLREGVRSIVEVPGWDLPAKILGSTIQLTS